MKPDIEINIDQLLLEGFTRKEAKFISQSLQTELHQLIENKGLENTLTHDYHQRNMHLKSISASENTGPEGVGRQIAQSIFNEFSAPNSFNTA